MKCRLAGREHVGAARSADKQSGKYLSGAKRRGVECEKISARRVSPWGRVEKKNIRALESGEGRSAIILYS